MATKNARLVSLDDFDRMTIDDQHRLHWDGEQIVTRSKIEFSWLITGAAVVAAVAALVTAAVDVLQFMGYGP